MFTPNIVNAEPTFSFSFAKTKVHQKESIFDPTKLSESDINESNIVRKELNEDIEEFLQKNVIGREDTKYLKVAPPNHINEDGVDHNEIIKNRTKWPFSFVSGFRTVQEFCSSINVYHEAAILRELTVSYASTKFNSDEPLKVRIDFEDIQCWHNKVVIGSDSDVFEDVINDLINRDFHIFSSANDHFLTAVKFDKKNLPVAYYQFFYKASLPLNDAFDELKYITKYVKHFNSKTYYRRKSSNVFTVTGYTQHGEFTSTENEISRDSDIAIPEFYPWFTDDIGSYFAEYMDSKASVLLAIGDPGTGKSTFFRIAIRQLNLCVLETTTPEIFMNPMFIPNAVKWLKKHPNGIVLCEDADIYLRKRTEGNIRMAELLNATSGLNSSVKNKFVFTTNLKNIDDIDPALIRPGRCFDYLMFRNLSVAQAAKLRVKMKKSPIKFGKRKNVSLAEALASNEASDVNEGIVKPRFL